MDLDTPGHAGHARAVPARALRRDRRLRRRRRSSLTSFPAEGSGGARGARRARSSRARSSSSASASTTRCRSSATAHIAYIAGERIIGISKLTRLVRLFARRFTVQERLGEQIADGLVSLIAPRGVAVHLEATHLCTQMRGVEEQSRTVTTFWRGAFDGRRAAARVPGRGPRPPQALSDGRRRARLRRRRRARLGDRRSAARPRRPRRRRRPERPGGAAARRPLARGARPDLARRGRGALGAARGRRRVARAGSSTPPAASAPARSPTPSPTTSASSRDLNLGTAWWSCREAARRLPAGGAIVNVASRTALSGGSRRRPPTRSRRRASSA